MGMTTINITSDGAYIVTDIDTAKQLLKKNSRCESTINDDSVELHYHSNELNIITSLLKTSKL